MKFLRILLIITGILASIIVLLMFIVPTKGTITRSTLINAPDDIIWQNISTFAGYQQWMPWKDLDPDMKITVDGIDGTVDCKSNWVGNDSVGEGSQTITKLEVNKEVDMDIQFVKPWKSVATSMMNMKDTTGGTLVTWTFGANSPRPWNIFNLFMSMDKMVGPDFQRGLENLKKISEATPITPVYQVNETDEPAKVYVGHREVVDFANMSAFFGSNFPKIGDAVTTAKLEMIGAPSGLYYRYDTVKMQSDMAAAFPVKEVKSPLKGWETFNIPTGKALEVDYYGDYKNEGGAYHAIDQYMSAHGMSGMNMVIEEYITDPMVEKDTSKWLTKIYYYTK